MAVEGSNFGQLNYGYIWTGNMGCSGTESHIRFCSNVNGAFGHSTSCNRNDSVAVICSSRFKFKPTLFKFKPMLNLFI